MALPATQKILSKMDLGQKLSSEEVEVVKGWYRSSKVQDFQKAYRYEDLFRDGDQALALSISPTLTWTGTAAFAILHDPIIGIPYDYVRGEYLIFGDGAGYAKWTAYRLPYLVPRTALKAKLGFTSVEAVLFDVIPRVTLDPYMTNWTRIYAKEGLWWTSLPEAIDAAATANDPDKLLEFLSDPRDVVFAGTSRERELPLTANGIDSWNRNQPPVKYLFEPFMDRMSPYSPVVDTFSDGYRLLADKLMKDKLDPNNAAAMDLLIDEMISDVRDEWTQIAADRKAFA
jgi:hypothetical protein